jgi:hypothetical protein
MIALLKSWIIDRQLRFVTAELLRHATVPQCDEHVALQPNDWLSIARPRSLLLHCLHGRVVVMREGDAHDQPLVQGESLHIDCARHLYVQADLKSELRFSSQLIDHKGA